MHTFWDTQPIQIEKNINYNGPINNNLEETFDKEPFKLPDNFTWHTFDLKNDVKSDGTDERHDAGRSFLDGNLKDVLHLIQVDTSAAYV